MKVLHFYKTYLPDAHGGAQQVIYEICEGTKRYGIDCEVLALTSHESETRMVGRTSRAFPAAGREIRIDRFVDVGGRPVPRSWPPRPTSCTTIFPGR